MHRWLQQTALFATDKLTLKYYYRSNIHVQKWGMPVIALVHIKQAYEDKITNQAQDVPKWKHAIFNLWQNESLEFLHGCSCNKLQ